MLFAARGSAVLWSPDFGLTWRRGPSVQRPVLESLICSRNLGRRLLRGGIHGGVVVSDGSLVVIARRSIWRGTVADKAMRRVMVVERGSRPLGLCNVPGGLLCFGEYFSNPERDVVHIYGSWDAGATFQRLYAFPAGAIRHVHGMFHDPYRHGIWILTGDESEESRFLFASEDFSAVDVVLRQGQLSRAVSVVVRPEGLYYGTDTPLEQNFLCFLDPTAGKVERLGELPSSCFSACQVDDTLFFECVAEPSQVNLDREVSLWAYRPGEQPHLFGRWERDGWPAGLFQFGRMALVQGTNPSRFLIAAGTAVKGADNTSLCWDLGTV